MQQSAIVDDTFGLNMLKRRIIFTIPKKTNRSKRNGKKQVSGFLLIYRRSVVCGGRHRLIASGYRIPAKKDRI
ncbi:Uncharacterised protein [Paenibacillus thiaminolyticus]|nr:Uncharacterised protein [Paenibacillus thiaminolyticus]